MDVFDKIKAKNLAEKERIEKMISNCCGGRYSWSTSEIKIIKMFNLKLE